jgi:hypothetical protein
VDGRVVFRESPTPEHQQVSRNLTMALLAVRPAEPCINVFQDTDMRYSRRNSQAARSGKRFTFRRPDISVLRLMDDGRFSAIEEHRLDWSGRNDQIAAVHHAALITELPEGIKLDVSFTELESV